MVEDLSLEATGEITTAELLQRLEAAETRLRSLEDVITLGELNYEPAKPPSANWSLFARESWLYALDPTGIKHNILVRTGAGTPSHTDHEGALYWDTTNNLLYSNSDGSTTWLLVGPAAAGGGGGSVPVTQHLVTLDQWGALLTSANSAWTTTMAIDDGISIPMAVPVDFTVTGIRYLNGTNVSGTIYVAIYDGDLNRLVTTSRAQGTTLDTEIADITDTELTAGPHYLAIGASNTTSDLQGATDGDSSGEFFGTIGIRKIQAGSGMSGMPDPLTRGSISSSPQGVPMVTMEGFVTP